jgi:hypothetical protein
MIVVSGSLGQKRLRKFAHPCAEKLASRSNGRGRVRFLGQFVQQSRGGAPSVLAPGHLRVVSPLPPAFPGVLPKVLSRFDRQVVGGHDVLDLAIRCGNALAHIHEP